MMSEKGFLSLTNILLVEIIVLLGGCLASCVMDMDNHSSDLNALCQEAERTLFIIVDLENKIFSLRCK